jgi:sugar phosphate permease
MMMWGLAFACGLQPWLGDQWRWWGAVGIALIGVMNYGPDTTLQGAAAQDIGTRWGIGKTSGFINGVSSVGHVISAYLVGAVTQRYGWGPSFYRTRSFLACLLNARQAPLAPPHEHYGPEIRSTR